MVGEERKRPFQARPHYHSLIPGPPFPSLPISIPRSLSHLSLTSQQGTSWHLSAHTEKTVWTVRQQLWATPSHGSGQNQQ